MIKQLILGTASNEMRECVPDNLFRYIMHLSFLSVIRYLPISDIPDISQYIKEKLVESGRSDVLVQDPLKTKVFPYFDNFTIFQPFELVGKKLIVLNH